MLGQVPAGGGTRVYRRADVEKVLLIKQLVFSEGLTLAGARRRLEEESLEQPTLAALAMDDMLGEVAKTRLRQVRSGLAAILDMLNRDVNAKSSPRTAAKRRKAS
jgi:DNA-binding transcriptional MerR regulator